MLGHKRDSIEKGLYSYPQGSHFIVYMKSGDGIAIARILHQNMEIERHFTQEQTQEIIKHDEPEQTIEIDDLEP